MERYGKEEEMAGKGRGGKDREREDVHAPPKTEVWPHYCLNKLICNLLMYNVIRILE